MNYGRFAAVYDDLMEDIPYEQYVEWIAETMRSGSVLDLACGTGVLSELMAELGYEVTASDLSADMLTVAQKRFKEAGQDIPVLQLSMDNLEGLEGFDAVTIAIDSLNYLAEEEQVMKTFKEVYSALKPGGYFFFDVHSVFKVDVIFMQSPFVYDGEDLAYIWHTEPGSNPHSVIHDLTFFMREGWMFERFEETHEQRTHPIETYKNWLVQAGFSVESVTADFTPDSPDEESERIFFRARK
ncbi:MAG: class I SAM-dependent DNA methyltransferase [Bacillota bacterium]